MRWSDIPGYRPGPGELGACCDRRAPRSSHESRKPAGNERTSAVAGVVVDPLAEGAIGEGDLAEDRVLAGG